MRSADLGDGAGGSHQQTFSQATNKNYVNKYGMFTISPKWTRELRTVAEYGFMLDEMCPADLGKFLEVAPLVCGQFGQADVSVASPRKLVGHVLLNLSILALLKWPKLLLRGRSK